jgi:hypothetical protein
MEVGATPAEEQRCHLRQRAIPPASRARRLRARRDGFEQEASIFQTYIQEIRIKMYKKACKKSTGHLPPPALKPHLTRSQHARDAWGMALRRKGQSCSSPGGAHSCSSRALLYEHQLLSAPLAHTHIAPLAQPLTRTSAARRGHVHPSSTWQGLCDKNTRNKKNTGSPRRRI